MLFHNGCIPIRKINEIRQKQKEILTQNKIKAWNYQEIYVNGSSTAWNQQTNYRQLEETVRSLEQSFLEVSVAD